TADRAGHADPSARDGSGWTFFLFQHGHRRSQLGVLGFQNSQSLVHRLRLQSPLLAALGHVGHAIVVSLQRRIELTMLPLSAVAAFAKESDQSARAALVSCAVVRLRRVAICNRGVHASAPLSCVFKGSIRTESATEYERFAEGLISQGR